MVSAELFAIRKVPPISVSLGNEVFVRDVQLTIESEEPIKVKLGAEIVERSESKKPRLEVTFCNALMLIESIFRKEAF